MKKGFTLIELVVVLVIVGILASLALSNFLDWIKKGQAQEAILNLETYKTAMEACLQENASLTQNFTCTPNVCMALPAPAASGNFTYGAVNPCNSSGVLVNLNALPNNILQSGIYFQRAVGQNGSWTCTDLGYYAGVCNS